MIPAYIFISAVVFIFAGYGLVRVALDLARPDAEQIALGVLGIVVLGWAAFGFYAWWWAS